MATILNYDEQGFIVGSARLESGMKALSDDTQEIIKILKAQNQIANTRMARVASNAERIAQRNTAGRLRNSANTSPSGQGPARTSSSNTSNSDSTLRGVTRRAPNHRASPSPTTTNTSSNSTRSNTPRERDENGRFIGGRSRSSDESLLKSLRSRAGVHGGGMGSAQGVDPLVDSLNEAKSLLSPVTRGAGMAGRAVKWSWSKFRSMKRREPLPRDEERHNRNNEKLLTKILRQLMRGGRSGGGIGLGGLLGRGALGAGAGLAGLLGAGAGLLGKGGKSLLGGLGKLKSMKFLGPIAALAGVADLAMNWGDMDHAGKSGGVGTLAGGGGGALAGAAIGSMIFPGVGTVVGGALGAWLGSEGGEWLGKTASPYIESWTTAIKGYNLPDKMKGVWENGMKPFFTKLGDIGTQMGSWIEQKLRAAGDFLGITGGDNNPAGNYGDSKVLKPDMGKAIKWGAEQLGIDPNYLASVISFETAGTFNTNARNPHSSATGLIQFMEGADNKKDGKYYGMTRDQFGALSPDEQMKYVVKYFKDRNLKPGASLGQVYDTVTGTGYKKGSQAYELNKVWDANGDGYIAPGESVKSGAFKSHIKDYFPKEEPVAPDGKPEPAPIVQLVNKKAEEFVEGAKAKTKQAVEETKEFLKKPVDEAIDEKLKDQGYGGLGEPAVKRPEWMQGAIDKFGTDNTVTGGVNRFAPAATNFSTPLPNLPISKLLQFPTMPKVAQRLDSGGQKPIIIQANSDTISQNVSDRGIAHAITGGLGQDRYWG